MSLNDELDGLVETVMEMFENGSAIAEIRAWLKTQDINEWLIDEIVNTRAITREELLDESGKSFGMSRTQRPKNTKKLIIAGIIAILVLANKDVKRLKKNPRGKKSIAGIKVSLAFTKAINKPGITRGRELDLINAQVARALGSPLRRKLKKRGKNISGTYLFTETKSAFNLVKQQRAIENGKKFLYIPTTVDGHSDICSLYEGRYWKIGTVELPAYHPNCKHIVRFMDKLPDGARVTTDIPDPIE